MLKIMFTAGEASGDMHAGNLLKEITRQYPQITSFGIGDKERPDVLIAVDYGGFNLRFIPHAKARVGFYRRRGVEALHFGNPLADAVKISCSRAEIALRYGLDLNKRWGRSVAGQSAGAKLNGIIR
ncbi:hypothetical protein CHS0354_030059 [Potamilus streckersoni]|uniref:Lipid-A-disaccharide synthase n=1 Tax=Potamilus streckersoni TaxID=2493646 RepID=A0AAE0RLF2_9BIVA|nr:hypothetical protein CHS0354_030059 [Potamilus streckersoni]